MASERNIPDGAGTKDAAIVTRRVIVASREQIFAAHADPQRLAAWWGPVGAKNDFEVFEFRTGGAWRFTMRMPDGQSYPMVHRFEEIVPPERIVVRHIQAGHDFTLRIGLRELPAGTGVTWEMVFDDPAEAARLRGFLAAANAQNLDRLAAHLGERVSGPGGVVR